MSKSKENTIDPFALLDKYPVDLLRLFFVARINFLQDGIVNFRLLEEFYKDFFLDSLGNLVSRVNKMVRLYNKGVIPKFFTSTNVVLNDYLFKCQRTVSLFQEKMKKYELTEAFRAIEELVSVSNKTINQFSP